MGRLLRPSAKSGGALLARIKTTPYAWSPDFYWRHTVRAKELAAGTQQTVLSFGTPTHSRIDVAFSGGPLSSPVTVSEWGTEIVGAAGEAAALIEEELDNDVTLSALGVATRVGTTVEIDWNAGIGLIDCDVTITPAEVKSVAFGGTLVDGDYTVRVDGAGLTSPVDATVTRTGGSPATAADMSAAMETAIEALAGVSQPLNGVVDNANDPTAGTNDIQFLANLAAATVTTTPPVVIDLTFGGTATNGTYSSTFEHESLPGGYVTINTARTGGTPASNTDLATQHIADIEASVALYGLVDPAASSSSGAVATVQAHPGVSGLTITTSAPSPGTLTAVDVSPTMVVTDTTPAAWTLGVAQNLAVAVNTVLADTNPFPTNMIRAAGAYLIVREAFPTGSTLDLGDATADAVIAGAAIDATGYVGDSGTTEGDTDYPEPAWAPVITLSLPDAAPATGIVDVIVPMCPMPATPAA